MPTIPLFPLGNALFPAGIMRLRIFEVRYLDMIKHCIATGEAFGVVALVQGKEVRTPDGNEQFVSVGTMARIQSWSSPMPAVLMLTCVGTTRFELTTRSQQKYGLWTGDASPLPDDPVVAIPEDLQPGANALGKLIAELQRQGTHADEMPIAAPYRLDESGWVADRWCELLPIEPARQAELLGLRDPIMRLEIVNDMLGDQGLMP